MVLKVVDKVITAAGSQAVLAVVVVHLLVTQQAVQQLHQVKVMQVEQHQPQVEIMFQQAVVVQVRLVDHQQATLLQQAQVEWVFLLQYLVAQQLAQDRM